MKVYEIIEMLKRFDGNVEVELGVMDYETEEAVYYEVGEAFSFKDFNGIERVIIRN